VLATSIKMAHNEIRHRARLVQSYAEVPPVVANASRLGQVFLNLLVNAAHAIEDGHADVNEVRVRVRADDTRVYVEIEDTGVGIPASVLPRIFDPFFTTKPAGVGVGLGLSICDRIVESFGGTINVTSKLGFGSTFRVALPIAMKTSLAVDLEGGVTLMPVDELVKQSFASLKAGALEIRSGQAKQLAFMRRLAPNFINGQLWKASKTLVPAGPQSHGAL